ncbi:MAG: PDZ domain-containing protein, partial [Actinomyces sp.]
GDRTRDENRERNLQMMQVSKETAVLVALEKLGVDVVDATGIGFDEVLEDGPAAGLLRPGDVIVALDGEPVTDLASLRALLEERSPGDEAVLTVENLDTGETRDVTLTLGVHPDGLPGGFIGIAGVRERLVQRDLPFEIDIDSGSIGGPSAGLAFTLAILDLLTPGDLTGGHRVAVTGTIAIDGTVGNVGGVAQKAAAARSAGAEVFIVPVDLVEEARRTAGDMRVVGVSTLDEALDVLAGLGGEVSELALAGVGDRTG